MINNFDSIKANVIEVFYKIVFKYKLQKQSGVIWDNKCGAGVPCAILADTSWQVFVIDVSDNSIENGKNIFC